MSMILDGSNGLTTPGVVNTAGETIATTLAVTGATNLSALTTTGNTILGDASTDTLNVGNGGLVKDASGRVSINQPTPSTGVFLNIAGTLASQSCIGLADTGTTYGTGSQYVAFLNSTGGLAGSIQHTAVTTVAYATTSDNRLKENIVDADTVLDKISAVKVRAFDWKEDKLHSEYGFIAQELYKVFPDAVGKGDDAEDLTDPKGTWQVEYGRLTPMLLKAIQELKVIVDAQAVRIAALES